MIKTAWSTLFLYFSFVQPLWSCPVCADLLNRGRDALAGFNLAHGLLVSILFMLAVPALMAISFYVYFRKKMKNHPRRIE